MFKPIKPAFKLNQNIGIGPDSSGVVAEIKLSIFAEPSYFVMPFMRPGGAPPAAWHGQSDLIAINMPAPIDPSPLMQQVRIRRHKSKR